MIVLYILLKFPGIEVENEMKIPIEIVLLINMKLQWKSAFTSWSQKK